MRGAGDVAGAMTLLPSTPHAALTLASGQAFAALLYVLRAVTVVTAVALYGFIGREDRSGVASIPARGQRCAGAAGD